MRKRYCRLVGTDLMREQNNIGWLQCNRVNTCNFIVVTYTYVCKCIIVAAGTTCTDARHGRGEGAKMRRTCPCFSSEGQGTPTLIFLCSYVLPWEIGNLGVLQLQPARVRPRLHPIEEIDPGTSRDSDALLQTTLSKYRRTTGAARFSQSDTNLFEVLSLCWACGHLPSLAIRATKADLNSLKN